MQKKGLEPSGYYYHTDLNRARLPIPPLLRLSYMNSMTNSYNCSATHPANKHVLFVLKLSYLGKKESDSSDSSVDALSLQ